MTKNILATLKENKIDALDVREFSFLTLLSNIFLTQIFIGQLKGKCPVLNKKREYSPLWGLVMTKEERTKRSNLKREMLK